MHKVLCVYNANCIKLFINDTKMLCASQEKLKRITAAGDKIKKPARKFAGFNELGNF